MIFFVKIAVFIEALQLAAIAVFRSCLRPQHRGAIAFADVAVILLIPLAALFGHNKNVFYGVLFLLPLLWIGDPAALAKRYVLALVLFPQLSEIYVVGNLYVGSLSSFTFLNAGALLALALTRRGRLKPVRPIDAAVWLLFVVSLLSVARGEGTGGTIRYVATTLLLVIPPYFIIARALASDRALRDTLTFVVLGGLCNAVVALFESVKHWALYEALYRALNVKIVGLSANLSIRAGLLRAGGEVANYETLGLLTGTALIVAVALRARFTRVGFYVVLLLLAGGLFASQARSAWLGTPVGLILYAVFERQTRRAGLIAVAGTAVGSMAYLLSSSGDRIGQLLGKGGHGELTVQYRQTLLDRGLEEVARHPLTGQTLTQLQVSMNDLRQGEHIIDFVNTHLLVTLVGGIGGLVAWLIAWGVPMQQAWKVRRRRVQGDAAISPGLPFALIGMTFVFLTFTSPIDRILSLTAISMGLLSVCIRVSASAGVASGRQAPPARLTRVQTARPRPALVVTPVGTARPAAQS